jgi:hypothetical protein
MLQRPSSDDEKNTVPSHPLPLTVVNVGLQQTDVKGRFLLPYHRISFATHGVLAGAKLGYRAAEEIVSLWPVERGGERLTDG